MTEKGKSQMMLVDDNKKVVVVMIGSQNLWKEHIRGMKIEVKGMIVLIIETRRKLADIL